MEKCFPFGAAKPIHPEYKYGDRVMKVVLVTNIPAPYRTPIFNKVAAVLRDNFLVVFSARIEPNRNWDLMKYGFNHYYLKENFNVSRGAFIHNNIDIFHVLRQFRPDVIITAGFNPTCVYAWGYSLLFGVSHIPMTDGWEISESTLGYTHRIVRRLVFKTSGAFLGAGKKSFDLYRSYGISECNLFQSHLCIDNERFIRQSQSSGRSYDVMFAGQIIERKMPDFFADVVSKVKEARGGATVLVIGDGPLRERFLVKLSGSGAEVDYAGFVAQKDLPLYYSKAKILLFTTSCDPWGIVANEALASGTPVITTPYSGVANDLVVDGWNGYVIDTDLEAWTKKAVYLLDNEWLLSQMRTNALKSVQGFTFEKAAQGIIAAAQWAFSHAGKYKNVDTTSIR